MILYPDLYICNKNLKKKASYLARAAEDSLVDSRVILGNRIGARVKYNIPSLGCQTKQGPPTFLALRVLAYSRTSFTQTPVDAWRKITFAAPAKNASNGIGPNFRVTRAVLISDRCAINRRIVCAVFAHGGQT